MKSHSWYFSRGIFGNVSQTTLIFNTVSLVYVLAELYHDERFEIRFRQTKKKKKEKISTALSNFNLLEKLYSRLA